MKQNEAQTDRNGKKWSVEIRILNKIVREDPGGRIARNCLADKLVKKK